MKIKSLLSVLLVMGGTLAASAQSQGYKDGIEYYKAGQYDNAITILQRTLNDSSTEKSVAYYYLGQSSLAKGDKAHAYDYFEKGVQLDAENPYNYVGLGAVALLNGNTTVAEDNFKTAQKLAKKNPEIYVAIARAYYNANPVTYARQIEQNLTKAAKDSKNMEPSIYILRGDMAYDKKDYGEAAREYEQAINFSNDSSEGYVKFANSYFYVNPKLAIERLETLLANHPESALAQRELAEKYYEGKYWKKAAEQYGRYIQNPNHFPEDKARYSVLLFWGENYQPSLDVANEILAQDPNNFLMQRMRFLNENAMGNYDAAVRDAQAFFKNNPNGYFTTNDYVKYAEALTGIGQDSLAVVQYELAVKNAPDNKELLKDLSDVYTRNKDYLKAAEAFDAYLQTQETPSINDLFSMTQRYLNLAATTDDPEQRVLTGDRGIEYINQVIERAQPQPQLYQRKARLYVARNGNRPDANAIEAYQQMLNLLDADPAAKTVGNPLLKLYNEAYSFMMVFYSAVEPDKDKHAEATAKLAEITELMNPSAE